MNDWFNPYCKRVGLQWWHYIVAHAIVVVAVIAFILGFTGGWWSGTTYNAHYFATHYSVRNEIPAPKPGRGRVSLRTVSVPLSAQNKSFLPSVTDQGTIGACAAESSTYYNASYEWRRTHPGSWLKFSSRFTYDHYSNTFSGGQDAGSWPDQDLETSASTGIPRFNDFPYGPSASTVGNAHGTSLQPFAVDNPVPAWVAPLAAKQKFTSHFDHLSGYQQGAGPGLVGDMENAIANGKLVMAGTSVPPAFDAASPSNPYIDFTSEAGNRGYHEITFYGYTIDPSAPGGAWFHFRNSWTKQYGLNGDAWYSARDVEQFLFGAETLSIS